MPKALQMALRVILYILRVALWAGLAVGLITFAFYFARDMSNIYIISTDGMQKRAAAVLQKDSEVSLEDFFTAEFIAKDGLLNEGAYDDYFIRDVDYKFNVEWMWVLPWNDTAKVRAREQVPVIEGEMLQEKMPQGSTEKIPPPPWHGAVYELSMKRQEKGNWLIASIKVLEELPEPTPLPLLTLPPGMEFPTATPKPSASPTPGVTSSGGVVVLE